jgi:sugar lactone lactonase YvrE
LCASTGVAFDASGNIYVANYSCGNSYGSVTVYAANPSGTLNESPIATITDPNIETGLDSPECIALDPSGNVYVGSLETDRISVYAANPKGTLNESALATITDFNSPLRPAGIAVDASGNIYAANAYGSITVYPPNPRGTFDESPIATIAGSKTGLNSPNGIGLDAKGDIYVTNGGNNSITVYPPNPSGTLNEAPIATIIGSNTGLNGPMGIALQTPPPTQAPNAKRPRQQP